jgi:hypothetical protein
LQFALFLIAQLKGLALMWAIAPQVVLSHEQVSLAIEVLLRGLSAP